MNERATFGDDDVLVIVDIQYDFCPGGTLSVPHGDEVIPLINSLAARFRNLVLTQDWHPRGHFSFASSHAGKRPYDTIDASYGPQVLWPDHCVQEYPRRGISRRAIRAACKPRGAQGHSPNDQFLLGILRE